MKIKLDHSFGKFLVTAAALLANQTTAWAANKCRFPYQFRTFGSPQVNSAVRLGSCPVAASEALSCTCGFETVTSGSSQGVQGYTNCGNSAGTVRSLVQFVPGDYDIRVNVSGSSVPCTIVQD